jgi:hypothetical protein
LVNEGYLLKPLEMEIVHLRERGFQVWTIHGGLNYWRVKGMPLEGDLFAQRDLNRVPPHAYHAEKDCHAWLKIDVSASNQEKDYALIGDAMHIPFEGQKEVFLKKWKAVMNQYSRKPLLSVLVFNRDGRGYEEIEKCIQATGEHNVFFLQGGLSEYGAFLNRQRHLLHPETKTTRPRPCPICPSN